VCGLKNLIEGMNMSSVVSWNLRLSIHEGRLEEFRTLMQEMVASTQAEAGTQGYEWFLSEDGTSCHINERYADSDAVMVHLGNFGANFADRLLGCATPTSIDVYGDPSDEVRAALAGFGAVHHRPFGGFSR
jgi:quinol monooxygenase YgiN